MKAYYWDPNSDQVVSRKISEPADVLDVFGHVRDASAATGQPTVEFDRGDGSALTIVVTTTWCFIWWADSLGATFHSVGDRNAEGLVVFDYFGHYTEIPASYTVTLEQGSAAAVAYHEAGSPITSDLTMEAD